MKRPDGKPPVAPGVIGRHVSAERKAAIAAHLTAGAGISETARVLRVSRNTVRRVAEDLDLPKRAEALPDAPASPAEDRRETHNAEFWRRRAKESQRDLAAAEHVAEQLAGIRGVPVHVPNWLLDTRTGRRGKSVLGCLISDVHMGEVVDPEEILGINAFNPDICRARLKRYFEAACAVGHRWASDTDCEGVILALAGDMVSNDLHHELTMTNALTATEQVGAVVEVLAAGIGLLLQAYPRVHIPSVPGNHGRTTLKSTAKLYSRLSYDTLVAAILAERFAGDERVTFQIGRSTDQLTPVLGRTIMTTHGDKMGTGGGQGFAGPMLPIVRGTKKIAAQQASIGRKADLIQHGHYHTTGNPGPVLANGSVPGYSEFGSDIRAVVEPPQQWLYLMHSKWGLRERAPIQLEEPTVPKLPRVRVAMGRFET